MAKRNRTAGGFLNGLLENGYFKLVSLIIAVGAYIWQGASWQQHVTEQFNMVSYQIAELDKRSATAQAELAARVAKVEGNLDPSSAWRSSVTNEISANRRLIESLADSLHVTPR